MSRSREPGSPSGPVPAGVLPADGCTGGGAGAEKQHEDFEAYQLGVLGDLRTTCRSGLCPQLTLMV